MGSRLSKELIGKEKLYQLALSTLDILFWAISSAFLSDKSLFIFFVLLLCAGEGWPMSCYNCFDKREKIAIRHDECWGGLAWIANFRSDHHCCHRHRHATWILVMHLVSPPPVPLKRSIFLKFFGPVETPTQKLQLHYTLHYTAQHPAVVGGATTATTQLQPPSGPSVDSLCHSCSTTNKPLLKVFYL